ncbi:retention module-containing protein [Actimicrobium antarcticum]|uniref:Cadherin-like domain-containing protein n=1 Tax=Actimicrobium antarcticum TaxID=1051899 RepID=A0ABP7TT89_9BURK
MATTSPTSATSVKPVANAGKAGAIGIVKLVVGVVTATDQSGVQRVLSEGDRVNANDVIQTSAAGAVDIQFADNTHLDLGRSSQIALDSTVFDPRQASTDQADVAAIQAAIAAGADPTTLVPATAAGAGGAGDEGGSSFVVVDQNAARGNVTSGFDTAGAFAPPPVVLLDQIAQPQPAGEVPPEQIVPPAPPATPPAVVADSFSTPEDTVLTGSVAANDTPGSAGGNVWSLDTGAANGTVVVNPDGSFSYTPNANFNGPDSFTYTLTDADGNSSSATVNVGVTPVNDPPVAVVDAATTSEDTAITITAATLLANDTDVDGNPLSIISVQGGVNGTVALVDGAVVFTPAGNYNGPASFTYTISDGQGGTSTATVNVGVPPVNDPPVAVADAATTSEDTAITITAATLLANDTDVDGNPLSIISVQNGVNGTVTLVDGAVVFTPATNYNGPASFTYTISDGQGGTSTATVNVGVTPVNDPPVAVADAATTSEDTAITLTAATLLANDTDVDGNPLSIISVQGGVNGTVALVDGAVVFTPAANYNGPASFTYTISDGQGGTSTATVNVGVTPVNDPPVAVADAATTSEDTAITITAATLLANDTDVDGNPLSIISVQGGVNGTVALVDGAVVFTPATNYNGPASFTYTISDGQGGTSTATVNVGVTPVNDPPVAVADAATTSEDTAITLTAASLLANDTDVDGNPLSIISVQNGVNGTVTLVDGAVVFTPATNYNGPASFTYTISDGQGGTSTATVNVGVTPVNDLPIGVKDQYSVTAGSTLSVTNSNGVLKNDSDIETPRSALTAVLENNVRHGTLTLAADGSFVYKPASGYAGTDSFTYRVNDGSANSDRPVTVTLSVDPLVAASSATVVGTEDTSLSIILTGSETGSHVSSFVIKSLPLDGLLFLANGTAVTVGMKITALADHATLVFKPDANESGGDKYSTAGVGDQHATYAQFTYVANGVTDASAPATISVNITPVADAVALQVGPPSVLSHTDSFDTGTAPGWIASNTNTGATGAIEILSEKTYGGTSTTNLVLEVESTAGINSLHQAFDTNKGAVYQLDLDFSTRSNAVGADSTLQVLVNGEVIGTLAGGATFGFAHHAFAFVGTGGADVVEFRALDGQVNTLGGLLDNIVLKQVANAYEGQAALLPSVAATFGDTLDHSEHHSIQLSGLTTGAVVSDGVHQFSATADLHTLEVFNGDNLAGNWNLNNLSVTAPTGSSGIMNVTMTAAATETSTTPGTLATHEFSLNYATVANDIINGNPGDEILGATLASDTFVYKTGDLQGTVIGDHITGFQVGTAPTVGDVLDISDLLSGAGVKHADFAGHEADFLKVDIVGGNTTIHIDLDGPGAAPVAAVPLVTLDGVGATLDSLLGNHQIHGV